jgi:predicted kinase
MEPRSMANDAKPWLIIVGGSPASGKSTLAEWLAEELRLPLLSRDMFKEALMNTLGSPDAEAAHRLGAASYAVLAVLQRQLLAAGVGMVLESNFVRGISEADLRPAIAASRAVAIYCEPTVAESKRRFVERATNGDRHPGHHDDEPEKVDELEQAVSSGDYDPLDLDIPHLTVDTTNPEAVDRAAIAAFVRAQTG